jgi:tetratricopeptide (TPR) repeat protein
MKHWLFGCLILMAIISCNDKKSTEKEAIDPHQVQLVEDLKQQVRKNPDSTSIRMRLVNALDSLGNYSDALVQLDTLIKKDSVNNGLWYAKAQLQESNKDTVAAIRSYERALNIYPSTDAQLSLGNLLAEHRDERCLLICQALTKLGMGREIDAHCAFIAGVYYARTNQASKALENFDKCINNNYTYMEAYMEKGFIYFEQKKYNDAMQIFDKAITVNNMYADAYYWKAKTFEAMGNKQEAITNYQRSLGLDKSLKEARAALDRLNG